MTHASTAAKADEAARPAEVKTFPPRPEAEMPAESRPETPETTETPDEAATPPRRGAGKKLLLGAALLVVLGFGGRAGYDYWTEGRFMVATDDAYLQTDITAIAPRVQGYVQKIAVRENQKVKAGDLLLSLDDGDYQNALKSALSRVATQRETITRIGAQVEAAKAAVDQAEAQKAAADAALTNARSKVDRITRLTKSSIAAQAQLDDATAAFDQAQAGVAGAAAQIEAAKANISVLKAQRAEAQGQLDSLTLAVDQARRDLDRTVLRAPVAGTVANIAVRVGDLVSPGQKLAAVVPVNGIYVEANYKETQLSGIAPGAKVRVTIDALQGQGFDGTVTSVAPATGAQFSLLPAENATGNFTKVVQRVPVRIGLPPEAFSAGRLRAGLSVQVAVDSRTAAPALTLASRD